MKHGFIKVAAATAEITPGDVSAAVSSHVRLAREADKSAVKLLLFPELSFTGTTLGDLFSQRAVLDAALDGLRVYLDETKELGLCSAVGLPVRLPFGIFNCMALCFGGRLLALVPSCTECGFKFSKFEEAGAEVQLFGTSVPFGRDILFDLPALGNASFACVFARELMSMSEYCTHMARAGAGIILAPDSSPMNAVGGAHKAERFKFESERLNAAVILCDSVIGESGNDAFYSSNMLIAECGEMLCASLECHKEGLIFSEVDTEVIFACRRDSSLANNGMRHISLDIQTVKTEITRKISKEPFLPKENRNEFCLRVIDMQSRALALRLCRSYSERLIIGVSGGLDSTLALIACVHCCDILGIGRERVIAITMPCFGTSAKTRTNAHRLCEALGVTLRTVDIKDAVRGHLSDISHADDIYDAAYENAQARERTQVLMDIANMERGIVVGTGDLSELALGFATYNGDHMSMYGVNSSLPKTMMQHIVGAYAQSRLDLSDKTVYEVLSDILATPISPELLPTDSDGDIAQCTENIVGPYILHDFFIYYVVRYGFSPDKILRLAKIAFSDRYTEEEIRGTLKIFIKRFFAAQFKRSCMPDGVAIGDISLSPRGAWAMPSDGVAKTFLEEI